MVLDAPTRSADALLAELEGPHASINHFFNCAVRHTTAALDSAAAILHCGGKGYSKQDKQKIKIVCVNAGCEVSVG